EILIDQGSDDKFLQQQQLLPNIFETACKEVNQPLNLRYQQGYDHSYYFISTFMEDHIRHHAQALQ
ncbi:MAG: alpha/beta hydrolase-fold protein, partial [Cyanobacteria bacterium P01_D01_bin.116]